LGGKGQALAVATPRSNRHFVVVSLCIRSWQQWERFHCRNQMNIIILIHEWERRKQINRCVEYFEVLLYVNGNYHRCQDFCSLHGFRLTKGARLRLGAQNLASSGAGMVASGSGLTCHVIP
jgi:hypothetical protein